MIPTHTKPAGFALPAVLIVVVAMLILVIALLLVTGIERQTARSFVDFERANLAVRAGLEELQDVLLAESMNDDFVVFGATREQPLREGRLAAPYLFIARADDEAGSGEIRYSPLFSHYQKPPSSSQFAAPEVESLIGEDPDRYIDFSTLPYQDNTRASWIYLTDENGRNVARYAWFVEDMQGRLDASKAGNLDGEGNTHVRAEYPFPAPGIPVGDDAAELPTISAAALYAIDPAANDGNQRDLARTLIENRNLMISPGSMLAAAGAGAPLDRDPATGRLLDPAQRAVEESLTASNRSYSELARIPFANGIDPAAFGEKKINLNKMLSMDRGEAVDQMAEHIRKALPDFDARKGGFPDDYIKTLAANALDYASDTDVPTVSPGEYRGVGLFPLVSSYLIRFSWDDNEIQGTQITETFRVSVYVELWNMTNKPMEGDVQFTLESNVEFSIGAIPDASFMDMTHANPQLEEDQGYLWFPPATLSLAPNEYRMILCGEVEYKFEFQANLDADGDPIGLGNIIDWSEDVDSGYRMKWNGSIVDESRGNLLRAPTAIYRAPERRHVKVRMNLPGHTYGKWPNFKYNMGDPRMAKYIQIVQGNNDYPQNYSPNRRNIRRNIYNGDVATKPKVYSRVLPSEWPDGGHNSRFSSAPTPYPLLTDERIDPLDSRFFTDVPDPLGIEAPHRMSDSGQFFSATELGNVYDPIMWRHTYEGANDTASIRAGRMPEGRDRWPDVRIESVASIEYGGGNTLRIGRPEHPAFDQDGHKSRHSVRLLDLFHAGIPLSESGDEKEGPLVKIDGHVNINTASRDTLRALAAGPLEQDPYLRYRANLIHNTTRWFAPQTRFEELQAPQDDLLADRVADGIIAARPFASPGDAVFARTPDGKDVFGNRKQFDRAENIVWSDAVAEEQFARIYNNSTVRSRNYRIWVVGQSIAPSTDANGSAEVLAETRKSFVVFADPGERDEIGHINPSNHRIKILHESDF